MDGESPGDLLPEILFRRTNRCPFLPMTIPGAVLASLRELENSHEASIVISTDRDGCPRRPLEDFLITVDDGEASDSRGPGLRSDGELQ